MVLDKKDKFCNKLNKEKDTEITKRKDIDIKINKVL